MKITVIIASPKKNKGKSTLLLNDVIASKFKNHKIKKIYLAKEDIAPCIACGWCAEHKGECVIKDGMTKIYKTLKETDILFISTPVFFYSMPGKLKCLIDRLQVFYEERFTFNEKEEKSREIYLVMSSERKFENKIDCFILPLKALSYIYGIKELKVFLNGERCLKTYRMAEK